MRAEQRDVRAPRSRRREPSMGPNGASGRRSMVGIAELAVELGVKVSFVRRLVHERRIPYYKVGRHVRFDPSEVHAWLGDGRVDALW